MTSEQQPQQKKQKLEQQQQQQQPTEKMSTSTTTQPQLKVFLRSTNAKQPTKGSPQSAGYDLYASAPTSIPAKGQGLVSTDLSIIVPDGTYGRVAPRSGLAVKHGISTGAGVVDADYRGEIKIVLFNHSDKDFEVEVGDRVAQLVLEKIVHAEVEQLSLEQWEGETTERGAGGFGSTGKK
ncbi:unnamed protein product [Ambrosiozyma monospora]|uniref:Unnamed protein product n=1 Tax=Ambrosiozyma monospora TaxID=43982 RepID=A0ACB5TUA9_AMBMO|nr:unnamed protein product [Ambrosiozyma monospora]